MPVHLIDREYLVDVLAKLYRDGERVITIVPSSEHAHVLTVYTDAQPAVVTR